jgi:2-oxoglutarate ferredoxin oxidoreductase subunit alpha
MDTLLTARNHGSFPKASDLKEIKVNFAKELNGEKFLPYKRDEKLSRPWAIPGTKGLEHRIGGLEKEHETGNISYEATNHEFMVRMREAKVEKIADYIPEQKIEVGTDKGKLLVLGWGSTFGAIKSAVITARNKGYDVSHAHLRYIKPLPKTSERSSTTTNSSHSRDEYRTTHKSNSR